MSAIVDKLKPFCSDRRPSIMLPFAYVEPDGSRWIAATNGQRLIMARTDEPAPARPSDAPPPPPIGTVIHRRPGASLVDVQALRDWCGEEPVCDVCEGTGLVPHQCSREHCRRGGEDKCSACYRVQQSIGLLGGVHLDRSLLRDLVRTLPDGTYRVSVGGATDPVTIWSDDWLAVAMPVRAGCVAEGPEFALPTEAP